MKYTMSITSPLGDISISGNDAAIEQVAFASDNSLQALMPSLSHVHTNSEAIPAVLREAAQQLRAYFAGQLTTFDLPLQPQGTEFQGRVWQALLRVGYGTTASYGQIAQYMGDTKAVRAVGAANGANPIAIIIPCHRIVGSKGTLTGYAGGLWRKQWLLQHESGIPRLFE